MLAEGMHDRAGAIRVWTEALELLPEPKTQWEAALWLYASIGDAYRAAGDLPAAQEALFDALNCPDGHANPLVLLRLGQTLADRGEVDRGTEYLLRAHILYGTDVFDEDEQPYLKLLRDRELMD